MKILTRDQILAADDLKKEFVPCPEWAGGDKKAGVYMKTPSAKERDAFEARMFSERGKDQKANLENMRAKFVAEYACDDEGKRIFTLKDIEALGNKASAPVSRLFDKGMELAGMTNKDVEDMTKNSETDPSEDSPSN